MLLVATMALLARCICAAEQPRCSGWELVNPSPQANHLRDVAYGGGRWVGVGEGTAVVSADVSAWSAVPLPGLSLHGVAYGNGVFVAVGAIGAIIRSADGVTWEAAAAAMSADLEAVAFAGGAFLAVGADATVLASSDGLAWTQEWPGAVQGDLAGVRVSGAFAGNPGPMFLVWSSSSIALRRLDGTWLPIPLPEGAVVSKTPFWVNSAICATITCPAGWCDIEECGPTNFYVTHDGVSWEALCYGLEQGPVDVVPRGKGLVGLHRYESGSVSTLWTTPDGWSWFEQPSAFNVPMHAIEAGNGVFVAVGDHGAIWTSPDGMAWTSASGPTIDLDRAAWNDVTFAASGLRRVSDGDSNVSGNEVEKAVIGGDGRQWGPNVSTGLTLAAGGPGLFVALGAAPTYPQSSTFSSIDASEWVERSTLPTRPLLAGIWDGARFLLLVGGWEPCPVLCTPNKTFASVGDGVSEWLAVEQPELLGLSPMIGMAFNGQRYVTIAESARTNRRALASEDGLSWRSVAEVPFAIAGRQAIASDGSGFVAVRGTSVLTSPDGLDWSSADIAPLHLIGVMWTGDEYVAVGDDGAGHAAIARSSDGVAWTHEAFPAIPARLLAVAGGRRVQLAVGTAGLTLRRECHPQTPSRHLRGSR